jgi:hypothetical protein
MSKMLPNESLQPPPGDRRTFSVPLREIVSTFSSNKRASHLAPLSSSVRLQPKKVAPDVRCAQESTH